MSILHIEMLNDRKYKEKVFGNQKDRLTQDLKSSAVIIL